MRDNQARNTQANTLSRRDMILAGSALTLGAVVASPREATAAAPAGAEQA